MNKINKLRRPNGPDPLLHPPDKLYLHLCPVCNGCFPLRDRPLRDQWTYPTTCCARCGTELTLPTPPLRRRIDKALFAGLKNTAPGTRSAALLTAPFVPKDRRTSSGGAHQGNYTPLLRAGLLAKPDVPFPLVSLNQFPLRPVVEMFGLAIKLGLPVDAAVLATLALEHQYVLALSPQSGVLEQLIATLVSVTLPCDARPGPPSYAFDTSEPNTAHSRSARVVTFADARSYYHRVRASPLNASAPAKLRFRNKLVRLAPALAPLRRHVLANLRWLKREDYRFPAHTLPAHRGTALGWYAWEACCPGVRLDYTATYELCRHTSHMLVWM